MNTYQQEQLQALLAVRRMGDAPFKKAVDGGFDLGMEIAGYMAFRVDVEAFFKKWFENTCTRNCYSSRLSACCSKDGIITFWADVVINARYSTEAALDRLETAILHPENDHKCIYLAESGCLWRVKPIVCEMFLCDAAEKKVFTEHPSAQRQMREIEACKKTYTWPDRRVLFEVLEEIYMDAGCDSPLMYMHNSPGLRRLIKARKA